MKRHAANLTAAAVEIEGKPVILGKMKSRKGNTHDPVPDPVIITDLKIRLGGGPIPLDPVE